MPQSELLKQSFLTIVVIQYKATDIVVPKAGSYELVYTPADGSPKVVTKVFDFKGPGVVMGMYNTDEVSIFRQQISLRTN